MMVAPTVLSAPRLRVVINEVDECLCREYGAGGRVDPEPVLGQLTSLAGLARQVVDDELDSTFRWMLRRLAQAQVAGRQENLRDVREALVALSRSL